MDTTLFPRVPVNVEGAVYETALTLHGEEREWFLDRVFADDPDGRARVERLLEHSGESSAFFIELREHGALLAGEVLEHVPEAPGEEDTHATGVEAPGSRIGPYVLISRIGEGGCGVVYEAEQQEPVRRHVALKIIRLGMDTESVIARFEAERQALALMDHPNIARVFDAGATATGRPYFVMERVSGEKITACCDRLRLGIVGRIELFIHVCHGIQHAHQKGVIHRDIKPSNILVSVEDGEPMPKVIDFGIAKAATPGEESRRAAWTAIDHVVGTPPYMSPEQVEMRGFDVDTRSDIYSLGALLYELLSGRAPFDGEKLAAAGVSEMRRVLLETEPPALSRLLAGMPAGELAEIAAFRNMEPARLVSRVHGDLERIVAKAMAKNRNVRYQTVNALSADLRRFLHHEPISARPPGRLYLLRKFVRRNQVACISAVAVAVSLIAGLGTSTLLYVRERQALAAQERLGREAEAARARESWLRQQAQARANVSQVAVLLSEGKIEEADALLRENPLESIEPSREAAGVFRALGNWNAIYGRWPQAVQCYVLLDQANRLDDPVQTVEATDLLAIAPALLKGGDANAYEKFREDTLKRHLPAQNSLQAEHLLKVCLLTPADASMLERLRSVAKVCASGVPGNFPEWEAFSLTLYYYRLGDTAHVFQWAARCLSYPDKAGVRSAGTLALTAVARFRSGDLTGAKKDLGEARRLIAAHGERKDPAADDSERGTWFSWVVAEQLYKEAVREIGPGD